MVVYESMWIERGASGGSLMIDVEPAAFRAAMPFYAQVDGIGLLRFDYVATVKGRGIFRASLQGPEIVEGQFSPRPEQLVWSALRAVP